LQYNVRFKTVEAQPVMLGGKPLMAFMAGGDMHLVGSDAFSLFFVPEGEAAAPPPSAPVASPVVMSPVPPPAVKKRAAGDAPVRMGRPRKEAPPPAEEKEPSTGRPVAVGQILGVTPPSVIGAVMLAVKEVPRTTAEVADRVIAVFPDASRGAVWGYVSKLVKEGRLEKRDDPATQLTKLYLKAAE
jgi:hypothetical protein